MPPKPTAILGELKAFDAELATRPRILFLNKADLIPEDLRTDMVEELRSALGAEMEATVVLGSATGEGIDAGSLLALA